MSTKINGRCDCCLQFYTVDKLKKYDSVFDTVEGKKQTFCYGVEWCCARNCTLNTPCIKKLIVACGVCGKR